jgi:hypothetical protein
MSSMFSGISNQLFEPIVKQYAFWKGVKVNTVQHLETALINYSHKAAKEN